MSEVAVYPGSPDEAGLSSSLKYERSRYNNASVFLPNTPIIINIVHSCESQFIVGAESIEEAKNDSLVRKLPDGSLVLSNQNSF
ncbi:unnamed protein product [Trichobilharzia szidati]|nr:unnamed protein product [Trichobilharzia szidati]